MFRKFQVEDIERIIKCSSPATVIYVGTDSSQRKDCSIFATVVVIHHNHSKGANVFAKIEKLPYIKSINQRIMTEVFKAVETAISILSLNHGRSIEIHLDINPSSKYLSSKVFKEALGYVSALGFKAVFKPESFAAYCVADYACKRAS